MPLHDHWSTTYKETLGSFQTNVLPLKRLYLKESGHIDYHLWTVFCMYSFCSLCQQWPGPSVLWLGIHSFTWKRSQLEPIWSWREISPHHQARWWQELEEMGAAQGRSPPRCRRQASASQFPPSGDCNCQHPQSTCLIWSVWQQWLFLPVCPRGRCCHSLTHWSQIDFPAHRNSHPLPWHYFGGPDNEKYIEYTSKYHYLVSVGVVWSFWVVSAKQVNILIIVAAQHLICNLHIV